MFKIEHNLLAENIAHPSFKLNKSTFNKIVHTVFTKSVSKQKMYSVTMQGRVSLLLVFKLRSWYHLLCF